MKWEDFRSTVSKVLRGASVCLIEYILYGKSIRLYNKRGCRGSEGTTSGSYEPSREHENIIEDLVLNDCKYNKSIQHINYSRNIINL